MTFMEGEEMNKEHRYICSYGMKEEEEKGDGQMDGIWLVFTGTQRMAITQRKIKW